MTDEQITANLRPHGSVKVLHPLKGSEDTPAELSSAQQAWLDDKATDPECLEVGACRFLPGGILVVECEGKFDRATFVIDREGNEL